MDVCDMRWASGGRQNLDDSSLHDAIAKPARLWLRRRTLNRLQLLVRQRLEYDHQGRGGVCTAS
jgi:hypothetical protein